MKIVNVTPRTLQRALDSAVAGDVIRLGQGTYSEVYTLSGAKGENDAPIVLEPDPAVPRGTVLISQERDAEWYRPQANKIARLRLEKGEYPGLWDEAHKARLRILGSRYVILRDLVFERSWPTHVYIDDSSNVTLQTCTFTDGTFCIVANGSSTQDIVVDGCRWMQDRVPNRIWNGIAWKRIHGHPKHECSWCVMEGDYRLFDGDFFRATGIRGGVTIRNSTISNAFNGIHAEGDGDNRATNRDFHIHNNTFLQIRDNAIEPEKNAFNWSVHDNLFIDNHAPFSFSCDDLNKLYIYANLFAFQSIQGTSGPEPRDHDCNRGGKVFKLKGKPTRPHGPNYVFHNTFVTRLKYMPKGIFEGLQHFNNAMHFVAQAGETFDAFPSFFGDPEKEAPIDRFTPKWSGANGYSIAMNGDVVFLPGWPDDPRLAGYAIGAAGRAADPGVERTDFSSGNIAVSDFATAVGGPCSMEGVGFRIELPDGQIHDVAPGSDVGALQNDPATGKLSAFAGPPFQRTLDAAVV